MWSTPTICIVCILFGTVCDVKECSQIPPPHSGAELQEEIRSVIEQIQSLTRVVTDYKTLKGSSNSRSGHIQGDASSRSGGDPSRLEGVHLNSYYSVLVNLYSVYMPLMSERFVNNLPETLVCILSGTQECGLEAELTRVVVLELANPLLALLSFMRSEGCTPKDTGAGSLFRSYLRMDEVSTAELTAFQEMLVLAMSQVPQSGSLMSTISRLLDMVVTYFSTKMGTLIQVPIDYVNIGLQFGITVPSLNQTEQCQQGNLKQLIMWGMKHNVSWSFGPSILDIFLGSESSLCNDPGSECPNPAGHYSRPASQTATNDDDEDSMFSCDRHNLTVFNETLCAHVLAAPPEDPPTSLGVFCRALSQLSPAQLEHVWGNTCHAIQALMSPVLTRAPACDTGGYTPPPPPPVLPLPPSQARRARASPNLRNLVCDYDSWFQGEAVDAGVVSLCSDNDRALFVEQVCDSPLRMMQLLSDPNNHWMLDFCGNLTSNPGMLLSLFCAYEGWMNQPEVPSAMVAFCWSMDGGRLKDLVCKDLGLFNFLFINPDNVALIPNCTHLALQSPTEGTLDELVADSCRYSEWHDVMQIPMNVMSLCTRNDAARFAAEVCANATFFSALLQNQVYASWLEVFCANVSQVVPQTTPPSRVIYWCDYGNWGDRHVDPSVVGLCWQHDKDNFTTKVCCNSTLFDQLAAETQNKWLLTACGDRDVAEMIPQVCRYSEWTRPIIVDMTDLARCAELDPFNFTTRVCADGVVLKHLLANPDNIWLLQHCINGSQPGEPLGFNLFEQCQYASWGLSLPDQDLMALCWKYDQVNFARSVCLDVNLLAWLAQDTSTMWVSQLCHSFSHHGANDSGPGEESQPCLARELVMRFNWSCSADLAPVCRPGASVTASLQAVLRCWVESLTQRMQGLSVLNKAASMSVVMLVALEERQLTSLRVTDHIRRSVLNSTALYLERETNFENKRVLLQCFGKELTSLMESRTILDPEVFLIQEYFRIPLESLRAVLSGVDNTTAREILEHYSRHKNSLQLTDVYLSAMVSVFIPVHLWKDSRLFTELAPLLPWASLADINALPPLQSNAFVRGAINDNLALMRLALRQAFGQWFSRAMAPLNMTSGARSLIRDTGNLIVYLPFQSFQHLSPAQLLDGLEVLRRNTLSTLQQNFIAQSIIGAYKNLSIQDFNRLGNLTCLVEPSELLLYRNSEVFPVIQRLISNCAQYRLNLPSDMLVPFLPWLGVDFLQELSQSQLLPHFSELATVSFTPTQTAPAGLQALGTLVVGLKVETVRALPADTLLSSLPGMAQNKAELRPPLANAISTKLWGYPDVVNRLLNVAPLLSITPLLSVLPHTTLLIANSTYTTTQPWNTQQAKALFRKVMESQPNLTKERFLSIGTVGQGVSCPVLQRLIAGSSISLLRDILHFLQEQPTLLHTSLKNCLINELYRFEFFSELLVDMGAEIALALPVSTVRMFPADMMDILRTMIIQDPRSFLQLPRVKQELLVDKLTQRLGMYTGEYTEKEFHSLGVMATFVVDEVFVQLRRSVFLNNLELLQGFCYSATKRLQVAAMLQEPAVFGPVGTWTAVNISLAGRFLFFLSKDTLQKISPSLLSLSHVERLFLEQSQWEASEVGLHCVKNTPQLERQAWFSKEEFVLQYFLGFLRGAINTVQSTVVTPGCEILHSLAPSLWPPNSLTSMTDEDFSNCLELIGQDPFLQQYQRSPLLQRAKQVHGPVSSLPSIVVPQLGGLAVALSRAELASLRLSEISSISAMGAVSTWERTQLPVLFQNVVKDILLSPNQLDSSTLVAMGHIVCGANAAEIQTFNATEFSKAVLWLGQLRLACSEEQFGAMVTLLSNRLAFGITSSWGQEVFIEIGVVAVGLPDMSMSALVKEQLEGITPQAISLIPPDKFAVVFSPPKIGHFTYEQAVAVTTRQREALSDAQLNALAIVLTPWDDRLPNPRQEGSFGGTVSPTHLCLLLGLLIWLLFSAPPDLDRPAPRATVLTLPPVPPYLPIPDPNSTSHFQYSNA
ncbi:uncharacterized protein strc1 [Gadus chalcogrammus]|uniref:uncharacterized protein strc1 n=1 Tax=Gadus chalcogrammus TaxID=1042646 RepID=UPI0024C4CD11|nr:uncharacterized protein strc1 [Gadus chalcogrammus]